MWQIFGTLIGSLLAWVLVVIVSRDNSEIGLGAEGVGFLNTTLAIFAIFSLLTVGMGKATSQVVSENISSKRVAFEYARNGTFLTIITGIVIGIVSIISSFYIGNPFSFESNNISSILFIIGIVMFVAGFRNAFSSNLAAVGEYDEVAKAFAANPLFQVISGIVLIILIKFFNLPVLLIIIVYIFGIVAQTIVLSQKSRRLWFNKQVLQFTKVDRRIFKLARQGFYFSITDIIPVGVIGYISVVLLLLFTNFDFQVVGAYSIILGYSLGGLIVVGFAWPLITSVAEAHGKGDTEKIRYYLNLVVKIFFYLTFLVLVFDIGLSRGIIGMFHGNIYLTGTLDVWIPFILVIIGYAIAGFEYILCGILLGVGKGRSAAVYLGSIVLLTTGFTALFLWLKILPSPLLNTGFGFMIGSLIMLPFLPRLIKKHVNQTIPLSIGFRSVIALVSTLALAALLVWPPLELIPITNMFFFILVLLLLVIIYFIFLIFFGAITDEEYHLLERKIKEYGLGETLRPLLKLIHKLMEISPFNDVPKHNDEELST